MTVSVLISCNSFICFKCCIKEDEKRDSNILPFIYFVHDLTGKPKPLLSEKSDQIVEKFAYLCSVPKIKIEVFNKVILCQLVFQHAPYQVQNTFVCIFIAHYIESMRYSIEFIMLHIYLKLLY